MARLQDFQTVTPTSSDKLLVVQSQGQGLVPYGSKLDSANPTGTGALSINRKANTTTGTNSVTLGTNCTASGSSAIAEGSSTTASGNYSHVEGAGGTASGERSHAEGNTCVSSGSFSHAEGNQTKANRRSQHTFGEFNIEETGTTTTKGTYIEIVGNGTSDANRSNARTLDWSGNEVLAGDLTINGNVNLSLKNYGVTINGVTYNLFMMGCMGILTIKTGTLTNAVNANTALVSLTDFSNDFTGKKFSASFQFVSTTDTTKRFDCANGDNTLTCPNNLSAGFAPRGCVPVIIQ